MEDAEFTFTLKGHPDEVGRVLRATMGEFQAIEKEGRDRLDETYRWLMVDRYRAPRGPFSSLRGTVTIKHASAELLGW